VHHGAIILSAIFQPEEVDARPVLDPLSRFISLSFM
jgi:hypothetical protein